VTHQAARRAAFAHRRSALAALAFSALALAACGSAKSTLPPAPGAKGTVSLRQLAIHPEVYADAGVSAIGSVTRVAHSSPALYALSGAHGTRIVLEPTSKAASYVGKSVRVSGIFTVSFKLGYEILISKIAATATL
jgi:hypothetical protein